MAEAGRPPALAPESQFPEEALKGTKQKFPKAADAWPSGPFDWSYTLSLGTAADAITPWGRAVIQRDRELRDFWPTETYLAGAVASMSFRNSTLDWRIEASSTRIEQAVTDMISAAIAGESFGWVPFMEKYSQDLYTQDNGTFVEMIREPTMDANSPFRNERAPVLGIAHLDSNQCVRTGNPEYPILYTDRQGNKHKMAWWQVIPFSNYPSAIERMNGVGYSPVTRALRAAQILRSIFIFKDEKISGRHYKQMHFVSGVSRQEIKDEKLRGQEEADNQGLIRFIEPSIIASLDPEKPVSVATIDLANLPDGFDFDAEMRWYISGLALAFGVDYQEFAPLPGGNIGSSQQSMILHRKTSGKGPAVLMRTLTEAFRNYGVLPRGAKMIFSDKDEQEELERQEVRTKATEEMAILVNQGILSPEAAAKSLVKRGILDEDEIEGLESFWKMQLEERKQTVGSRGGNTIREDANRTESGKTNMTVGDRLRKSAGILFGKEG